MAISQKLNESPYISTHNFTPAKQLSRSRAKIHTRKFNIYACRSNIHVVEPKKKKSNIHVEQ